MNGLNSQELKIFLALSQRMSLKQILKFQELLPEIIKEVKKIENLKSSIDDLFKSD